MHRFVVACAIFCVLPADVVLAQAPPNIKGNWVAKTAGCGDLKLKITSQSQSGIVGGSVVCARTGEIQSFGQKMIAGKQMAGKFDGTYLNIEGSQSLTSVKFDGNRLVGFAYGGPGSGTTPVAFVKQ